MLLVPDFVTTLIMPPPFRPYSAVELLVRTLNSATVSGLGLSTIRLLSRLLFTPPSRRYVIESPRPPATLKPPLFGPVVSCTPGISSASERTLRPFKGRFTNGRLVTD